MEIKMKVRSAHDLSKGFLITWDELTNLLITQRPGNPVLKRMLDSLTKVGMRFDPNQFVTDMKQFDKAAKWLRNAQNFARGTTELATSLMHFFNALGDNTDYIAQELLKLANNTSLLQKRG